MSEPSSKEPKDQPESDRLDLSDLQSFSFGTQWTEASRKAKGGFKQGFGRESGRGKRPDRRQGGGGPAKDRRPQRKPFSDRGPRSEGGSRPNEGGGRFQNRGQRREGGNWRRDNAPERAYESAVFDVSFYPDDTGFSTIIKALRMNHITYELFHVAKIFLEKSDRYVASVTRKAAKDEKAERVYVSIPDGMPFETEDEAIQHAVSNHADELFDVEEVEVEAPSGNFPFVNRCGITKVLLGPPNYHRFEEFLIRHHQTRLSNMPFEKFKASIEQVREEEAVNEWLESMKKTKRYTSKPIEGEEARTFESLTDAIGFLKTERRDQIVKPVTYARVSGVTLDKFANTEASRAVAGELERQRRFPLETANAIRGRLRREKFSIYKKGAKGVTFICSTKRNFRKAGQVMSDSLDRLIRFLETNQNIKAKELPPAFEAWMKEENPEATFDEKKLFQDLHWLVADGYVSHFGDDTLIVQPVMDSAPKPKGAAKSKPRAKTEKAAKAEAVAEPEAVAKEEALKPTEASEADSVEAAPAVEEPAPVAEEPADAVVDAGETVEESEATEAKPEAVESIEAESVEPVEVVESAEAPAEAPADSEEEPKVETEEPASTEDENDPELEKTKTEV